MISLHNHSCYSKKDGLNKMDTLVSTAKKLNQPSMALTDHGELSGLIRFQKACDKHKVKPIFGIEVYHAHETWNRERAFHLVLLVKNEIGWKNLIALSNEAYTAENHFYHTMRVTWKTLDKYREGLVCLTACMKGMFASEALYRGNPEQILLNLYKIFGNDLYIEIMYHGIPEQIDILKHALRFHREYKFPVVWTNDVHYAEKGDAEIHDMLMCCQYNIPWIDKERAAYSTPEFYIKNEPLLTDDEELNELIELGIETQNEIDEKCNHRIELGKPMLPSLNKSEELYKAAKAGFKKIYGGLKGEKKKEYIKRFDYEWKLIESKGFSDYLWIVKWYTDKAREIMRVGISRGSVGASLFCQCVGITDSKLDPIKYGLIFERFISPDRLSMPDVDNDFEDKDIVASMIAERFGSVATISSHSFFSMYSAFQDVGKVLGYSDEDVKTWTTTRDYSNPRGLMDRKPDITRFSDKIKDSMRDTGTHAAGVVLLTKDVPIYKNGHTQWDKDDIEEYGLIKFDVLGLKTLCVISKTIEVTGIEEPDWTYDDKKVFKMLNEGYTAGVFQVEKCSKLLRQIGIKDINDLIASIAINRPGPLGAKTPEKYANNRRQMNDMKYPKGLEGIHDILKETYHTLIYQEQVLRICSEVVGFTIEEAEKTRWAMGKKKPLGSLKEKFYDNLKKKNVDDGNIDDLFNAISGFTKYAFNKAHAAAYGFIAYQTAWLKLYYPGEYMAAWMTEKNDAVPWVKFERIKECERLGIKILEPNIFVSGVGFKCVHRGDADIVIYKGLTEIDGIAEKTAFKIIEGGPYRDVKSFLRSEVVGKSYVKKLEKSGALR